MMAAGRMKAAAADEGAALRRAARDARSREDWATLLMTGNRLQEVAPDSPDGYLMSAAALRNMKRRPEMRSLVAEACERFPDNERLQSLAAGRPKAVGRTPPAPAKPMQAAALRAAVAEAINRSDWETVRLVSTEWRQTSPGDPGGFQFGVRALRELKRLRQADALSETALQQFPDHSALLLERAAILQKLKRLEEAAACYARIRALLPDLRVAYSRGANTLILMGKFDEAEALIDSALLQFPADVELLVERAVSATRRRDFALARARWEDVRAVAPDDRRLQSVAGDLALAEQLDALGDDDEAALADRAEDECAGVLDDAGVMRRFEGLGGNCEFGLAQRIAGIEPLGLLRFAAITVEDLIAMLEADFAGVGEEANTELTLSVKQEYMLDDTRFFRTHTFITVGDTEEAVLLPKLRKRTAFLRDKLKAELRQGNKIFLFRPPGGVLEDESVARLHAAVRRYGPAPLVCVNNADETATEVTVELRGDGLVVASMPGHTSKLNMPFVQDQRYPLWLRLCRQVLEALAAV